MASGEVSLKQAFALPVWMNLTCCNVCVMYQIQVSYI